MTRIGIIGGGAAGMFAAICLKEQRPRLDVVVLESGERPLRKVAVSGGGRCNVTNTFATVGSLEEVYPRGARLMRRLLHGFASTDMREWLSAHGVPTVVEGEVNPRCAESERECVFPQSEDAMSVVGCLVDAARRAGVRLLVRQRVVGLAALPDGGFRVATESGDSHDYDRVVVATGGSPRADGLSFLPGIGGLATVSPVPSLFALALADDAIRALQGTVAEHVSPERNTARRVPCLPPIGARAAPPSYVCRVMRRAGWPTSAIAERSWWIGRTARHRPMSLVGWPRAQRRTAHVRWQRPRWPT